MTEIPKSNTLIRIRSFIGSDGIDSPRNPGLSPRFPARRAPPFKYYMVSEVISMAIPPKQAYVRPAAVAGSFYPADPFLLREHVRKELRKAMAATVAMTQTGILKASVPKAVIVPHAGYQFSGGTAALAYALLERGRGEITRAVILGPTHRVAVRGVACCNATAFDTPLGAMQVDVEAERRALDQAPAMIVNDATHEREHAVEVQLPFVNETLGDVDIVPLNVGDATPRQVGDVLRALWGGPETVIIISSDLSHYFPHETARRLDDETIGRISESATPIRPDRACGAYPINGLLEVCKEKGLHPVLLGRSTSGDDDEVSPAGSERIPIADLNEAVVGYASFAVWQDDATASDAAARSAGNAASATSARRSVRMTSAGGKADDGAAGADDAGERHEGTGSSDKGAAAADATDDGKGPASGTPGGNPRRSRDLPAEGTDASAGDFEYTDRMGDTLLLLARNAIARALHFPEEPLKSNEPWLKRHAATFVTLTENGQLRGCIGTLQPYQSIGKDVQDHAIAAAFDDPRFAPVSESEYPQLTVEVSVLSQPKRILARTREDLLAALRPYSDGLIITDGAHRATFLPQVWEQLNNPHDFVSHLLLKAGLPGDYWSDTIRAERYSVMSFTEPES